MTGGGDVSVQSSGLSINLVTKSGSNVFKGTRARARIENDAMQGGNVTEELFSSGTTGLLSGNPIKKISNYSVEYGGPIKRNRLWWWAAADHQDINAGVINFFDRERRRLLPARWSRRSAAGIVRGHAITYDELDERAEVPAERQDADQEPVVEVQLPAERARTSSSTCSRATTSSATPAAPARTRRRKR